MLSAMGRQSNIFMKHISLFCIHFLENYLKIFMQLYNIYEYIKKKITLEYNCKTFNQYHFKEHLPLNKTIW